MLPIILAAAAVGTAMISSNKSIAKKVVKRYPKVIDPALPIDKKNPIEPIITEPIIIDPIVAEPIVAEPIVGQKPVNVETITTDIIDATNTTKSTTKTGKIIVGELDKGSFVERVKKGSIYVAPLDKGEFVPDKPKLKGSIYVAPLDKGSFDKPKTRKGIAYGEPIENYGKWVDSQVVNGNIIMIPTTTITNPIKKSVKIIIEPLPVGEKDDWEARTAENPSASTTTGGGGGGGGGDISGGSSGYGGGGSGGGGFGWSGLNSWLLGLSWGTSSGKTVTIDVSEGTYQGTMEQE